MKKDSLCVDSRGLLAYKRVNANMHTPLALYKFLKAKFLLESASLQSGKGRYSIIVLSTNFMLIKDVIESSFVDSKKKLDSKKSSKNANNINIAQGKKSTKNSKNANFIAKDSTNNKKDISFDITKNIESNNEKTYTYFYKDSKKSYDLSNLESYKILPPILKDIKKKLQNLDSNNSNFESKKYTKSSKNANFIESKLDFLTLASMLREMYPKIPKEIENLPLPLGGIGYVSYEFFSECESVTFSKKPLYDAPQAILAFPKECIIFDHFYDEAYIVVSAFKGGEFEVQKRLQNIESKMQKVRNIKSIESKKFKSKIIYEDSKEWYKKYVKVIKNEIYKGTFLQCVLSRAMCIKSSLNPLTFYEKLRQNNPSPYMYFLDFSDFKIIGASPEVMLKCENGLQTLRPIAGTRARGATLSEDNALASELLSDEKESAEHLMLVDLGRNDIGKCARAGSVRLDAFRVIERYSRVMHIVSQVSGEIAEGRSVNDCFKACFPAGTISGAPKIEAISKLQSYERHGRGIYSGAILYFTRSGDLNSAITLRSAVFKDGVYFLQAGAGIVIDSNEQAEYLETCKKMQALCEILLKE